MKNYVYLSFIFVLLGCKKDTPVVDSELQGRWVVISQGVKYFDGKSKLIREENDSLQFYDFKEITIGTIKVTWIDAEGSEGTSIYKLTTDSLSRGYILFSDRKFTYTISGNNMSLIEARPGAFGPGEKPYYGLLEIKFKK